MDLPHGSVETPAQCYDDDFIRIVQTLLGALRLYPLGYGPASRARQLMGVMIPITNVSTEVVAARVEDQG